MNTTTTTVPRGVLLGRRLLTLTAVAALIGSVAATMLDTSVALADRAVPQQARPPLARAEPPSEAMPRGLTGKLNLNTATTAELELLPGVGPTKAERIVAFRAKQGAFKRIHDLRRVKGFGKKTVDRLAPFLTVTERSSLTAR